MLINQSLAILGAGHDTVAQTICLAIYHLSKDIPLQQRVRDEILQAELPDLGPVTSDAAGLEKIESLPLLTALMNETLRLYPTISILTRQATQDVELCGKVVPRGTNVVTVAGAVQRDPRVWGCAAGAEDEDVEKRKPRDLETFDADR
jgi:cytochrome P450